MHMTKVKMMQVGMTLSSRDEHLFRNRMKCGQKLKPDTIISDNNLITKNSETRKTTCKTVDFNHEKHQKPHKKQSTTPYRYREGGRTVGSGRVATIIE